MMRFLVKIFGGRALIIGVACYFFISRNFLSAIIVGLAGAAITICVDIIAIITDNHRKKKRIEVAEKVGENA